MFFIWKSRGACTLGNCTYVWEISWVLDLQSYLHCRLFPTANIKTLHFLWEAYIPFLESRGEERGGWLASLQLCFASLMWSIFYLSVIGPKKKNLTFSALSWFMLKEYLGQGLVIISLEMWYLDRKQVCFFSDQGFPWFYVRFYTFSSPGFA